MSAREREEELESFKTDPTKTVCLVSLRAGAYGLNLTCASQCVILDPFWNPFVEDQAIDRIHRIGQVKPVVVHRIVIEGTVEDRILALQEKKRDIIEGALAEDASKAIARLSAKDLLFLFGING
jgi:SNF2 family DNA or RNA helicase